jgi:hypothetical protein
MMNGNEQEKTMNPMNVDASSVIDQLTAQIAALTRENAIQAVQLRQLQALIPQEEADDGE